MKIFSGSSNKPLAEKIAKELNTNLSPLEIHIFPDGERRVRVLDKIANEDVIIVQNSSKPVERNYMELFFIIDAIKRNGGKSITAVVPYLGYQRQDHVFRSGEAVSLDVIVKMLEAGGVEKLIVFDLHSVKIPELFNIPVKHLSALPIFAEKIKEEGWTGPDTILVAPDTGARRRIQILSDLLGGAKFAVIEKERDLVTGEIEAQNIEGLDNQKRAIIVDDMISSGGTIAVSAEFLKKKGVEEVIVFATHPVFSKEAPDILEEAHAIKKVYVTDTIAIPKDRRFEKLQILSVAKLVADELES